MQVRKLAQNRMATATMVEKLTRITSAKAQLMDELANICLDTLTEPKDQHGTECTEIDIVNPPDIGGRDSGTL